MFIAVVKVPLTLAGVTEVKPLNVSALKANSTSPTSNLPGALVANLLRKLSTPLRICPSSVLSIDREASRIIAIFMLGAQVPILMSGFDVMGVVWAIAAPVDPARIRLVMRILQVV
jgi:hypothetical protein